jgi:3-oxoacyl-[acyl-carrier-protein] synthase II
MDNAFSKPRVVVTGLGVICSIGEGIDQYWSSLLSGTCGIARLERFDSTDFPCQIASEVRDFDPSRYMDPKEVRRNDRFTHFAVGSTKLALEDSNLDLDAVDRSRFGVVVGSGIGGMETIEKQFRRLVNLGPRKVSPFTIPSLIVNIASGVVAIEIGARGPNFGVVSACATATHAIGESFRMIQAGEADIMVAGGSEAAVTPLSFAGFCSMRAMSSSHNDDPDHSSRPFDLTRDGFIMGEGSGVVILETLEHAQSRKAKIYCELVGYAATCDAYHITSPDPGATGLKLCLRKALKDGGVAPEEVDYINAHGTSTPVNDSSETFAMKEVFGSHAYKLMMSSTKSMTGHLLGAAGGIELAAAAKSIETNEVPPTINLNNPDPDCDLNYVPNVKAKGDIRVAVSNNSGFGGHNASLVLKAID